MDALLLKWFLGPLGVLISFFFLRWWNSSNYRGLSSPRTLPIIGHLHLLDKFVHHSLMTLSQQYGPYMFLKLGSVPTLVLSSANAAKEALKTHDVIFSSRPVMKTSEVFSYRRNGVLWAPYGDHWRKVRKLCTLELLTGKRVEISRPLRAEEMSLFLSKLAEISNQGEVVNVRTMISDLTYNIMTRTVFGKSYGYSPEKKTDDEAWEYKRLIEETFVAAGKVLFGDYIPWLGWLDSKKMSEVHDFHKQMDEYLQKQIDEHRLESHKYDDFLSVMLQNPEFGNSDTIIKAVVTDVIAGGTDTSALTLEWGLAELIRNPEIMLKVRQELDDVIGKSCAVIKETDVEKLEYLTAVVKETLRLHPPAPLLIYETTEDCQLSKCFVPKKARILINIYAIARDECSWDDPLRFNPQRFIDRKNIDVKGRDFEVLPFGAGRRGCPGIQLGLTMVQFMLANLIHGFNWEMPDGLSYEDLNMSEAMGLTIPRAVPLELIPSAR